MDKSEMTTNEVVNFLMNKGNEIDNKIINTISEVLRLGYETERGKGYVKDLRKSIEYTLDEMERVLNRQNSIDEINILTEKRKMIEKFDINFERELIKDEAEYTYKTLINKANSRYLEPDFVFEEFLKQFNAIAKKNGVL